MDADKSNAQQSIEHRPLGSWASTVIDYFDSKARLLAVESKEASQHFVGLLMLVGVLLVLALSSAPMYGAFLLYLVSLLLHLAWGWSAFDRRSDPYYVLCPCFASFKSAAPQAGIPDDVKRS